MILGEPHSILAGPPPPRARWPAAEALRGLVMLLMALDHVRDHFTDGSFSPTDLSRTTAALCFTRWITHFCAPAFFLLAGLGASLSLGRGRTRSTLAFYLVSRGLWLIVLEVTVVSFAWTFDFPPAVYELGVIWAMGCSMVLLGGLVYLPRALIAALAVLLIVGHNLREGSIACLQRKDPSPGTQGDPVRVYETKPLGVIVPGDASLCGRSCTAPSTGPTN